MLDSSKIFPYKAKKNSFNKSFKTSLNVKDRGNENLRVVFENSCVLGLNF